MRTPHTRGGADGFFESVVAERLVLGDGEADVGQGVFVKLAAKKCAIGGLAGDKLTYGLICTYSVCIIVL